MFSDILLVDSTFPRIKGDTVRLETIPVLSRYKCLEFYYRIHGESVGRLNLYTQYYDGHKVLLWRLAGNQGNGWNHARVPTEGNKTYKVSLSVLCVCSVWLACHKGKETE